MPGSEVIINNLGEIFNTVLGTIMDVMWNLSTLGTAQSVLITEVTSIQGYLTRQCPMIKEVSLFQERPSAVHVCLHILYLV